jgi:hypothetical protein
MRGGGDGRNDGERLPHGNLHPDALIHPSIQCFAAFQLHLQNYDTGRALQALVQRINPKCIDKRWSEEEAVRSLTNQVN